MDLRLNAKNTWEFIGCIQRPSTKQQKKRSFTMVHYILYWNQSFNLGPNVPLYFVHKHYNFHIGVNFFTFCYQHNGRTLLFNPQLLFLQLICHSIRPHYYIAALHNVIPKTTIILGHSHLLSTSQKGQTSYRSILDQVEQGRSLCW